jgi:hypothetical protein
MPRNTATRPTTTFAVMGSSTPMSAPTRTTSSDPVEVGLVASLARPGGNVTGRAWQRARPRQRTAFMAPPVLTRRCIRLWIKFVHTPRRTVELEHAAAAQQAQIASPHHQIPRGRPGGGVSRLCARWVECFSDQK